MDYAPPSSVILMFAGLTNTPTAVPNTLGTLVPVPVLTGFPLFLPTDINGSLRLPVAGGPNSPIAVGFQVVAQNGAVIEFSNAIELTLGS